MYGAWQVRVSSPSGYELGEGKAHIASRCLASVMDLLLEE